MHDERKSKIKWNKKKCDLTAKIVFKKEEEKIGEDALEGEQKW